MKDIKTECVKYVYELDKVMKTYRQFKLIECDRRDLITDLIRIEKNNGYNSITGANNLFRIKDTSNWNRSQLTGMRPTPIKGLYYGDLRINNKKCLLLFKPEPSKTPVNLIALIFPEYYTNKKNQIATLINDIINNQNLKEQSNEH